MAEPAQSPAGAIQGQDPNVVYALGSSPGESARLQRQADELADDSAALLDRVGLRPGQSVIDLGCGPQRNSMSWIRRPGLISRTHTVVISGLLFLTWGRKSENLSVLSRFSGDCLLLQGLKGQGLPRPGRQRPQPRR
jgi:hypothetical protein